VSATRAKAIGRDQRDLHAYHDGELGGLRRWLFERRLGRSPALRAELAALERLTQHIRASELQSPSVDVWDAIALRLPAIDAQSDRRRGPDARPARSRVDWLVTYARPITAVAVAAALALALFLGIMESGAPAVPGMIRWMDTGGRSVMVLEDQGDATIVWLLDEGAPEGGSGEAV